MLSNCSVLHKQPKLGTGRSDFQNTGKYCNSVHVEPARPTADILKVERQVSNAKNARGEQVSCTKFLEVHITEDVSWKNNNTSLDKKVQQRLYFFLRLKRATALTLIMHTFYGGTNEGSLTSCITLWFASTQKCS